MHLEQNSFDDNKLNYLTNRNIPRRANKNEIINYLESVFKKYYIIFYRIKEQ